MTQSRLGACLGVSFQQIQKYEKGVSGIKLGTAVLMTEALGIGIGDLVDGDAGDPHAHAVLADLGQLPSGQRRAVEELIRMLRIANQ
jgi:transcriptional regulator with XRE-family HTH domain